MEHRFSGVLVRYVAKERPAYECCAHTERAEGRPIEAATATPAAATSADSAAEIEPPRVAASADHAPAEPDTNRTNVLGQQQPPSSSVPGELPSAMTPAIDRRVTDADTHRDELHVNLWELKKEPFLDVGIMIAKWRECGAVQIDVPWEVSSRQVGDIGALLNSEKAVAAVFNEVVDYRGRAGQAYAEISFQQQPGGTGKPDSFLLLRLNSSQIDVRLLTLSDGSVCSRITLRIPEEELGTTQERIYLRFRIRGIPKDVYSTTFDQRDRNLLSSSTETRIIDFRINVRRGIPDEVLASNGRSWFPEFRKIHFFLTVARAEICEFQNKDFVGCRSLVDEREWTQYALSQDDSISTRSSTVKDYLGYQWTAKGDARKCAKDLLILGRFTSHRSNIIQIIRFVVLVVLFGMIGGGLWDVIKPHVTDSIAKRLTDNTNSLEILAIAAVFAVAIMVQWAFYVRAVREIFWDAPRRIFRIEPK